MRANATKWLQIVPNLGTERALKVERAVAGKKQAGRPKPWPVNVYGFDETGKKLRTRLFYATREEAEQRAVDLRRAARALSGRRAFDLVAFEAFLEQRPAGPQVDESARADWARWAEEYLRDLAASAVSERHVSQTRTRLQPLLKRLDGLSVEAVTVRRLQQWLNALPWSSVTRKGYRVAWSGYFA